MWQKFRIKGRVIAPSKLIVYKRLLCSPLGFCIAFSLFCIASKNISAPQEKVLQETSPTELSAITGKQRQSDDNEIQNILDEIGQLIKAGRFNKAVEKFKIINQKYHEFGKTEITKQKLQELKGTENSFYQKWSDHLGKEANLAYKKKAWNDSIKLANESIIRLEKSNDNSAAKIAKKINIINLSKREIANTKFQKSVSLSTTVPGYKIIKSDIDLDFVKAKTFMKNKQYENARDSLEQILISDPYNFKAMYMLKNLYGKLFEVAKNRTDNEYRERMAQVKWAYGRKASPNLTRATEQLTKVMVADEGSDMIRYKLKNIIIKKIDLDDATISSVITYLNRESKKLDKDDNAGINIVLRLNNSTEDNLEQITMSMDDIPFEEVLKYICLATGLRYRVEEHAVIIGNESIEDMITGFFTIESDIINSIASDISIKAEDDFLNSEGDISGSGNFGEQEYRTNKLTLAKLKRYFTNRGVPFPEGSSIAWDVRANTLTATNIPENLRILDKLLKEIDFKIPLVLIETKFVEITETDLKEFGFDWKATFDSGTLQNGAQWGINQLIPGQVVHTAEEKTAGTTQKGNDLILRHGGTLNNTDQASKGALIKDLTFNLPGTNGSSGSLSVWLYALDQSNIAEILSMPKVITKSGTTALIRMVEEEFFPISWDIPTVTTLSSTIRGGVQSSTIQVNQTVPKFKKATDLGIKLKVTPTVSPNNYTILLELEPEISSFLGWTDYKYTIETWASISEGKRVGGINYTQPVKMAQISSRKVKSKVVVYDGSTTVLGGMITDDTTSYDDTIPFLSEIPLAGRLFRSEYKKSVKKNLLIFVTARLIKPDGTPFRQNHKDGLFNFEKH